jgi:hypothetical protein
MRRSGNTDRSRATNPMPRSPKRSQHTCLVYLRNSRHRSPPQRMSGFRPSYQMKRPARNGRSATGFDATVAACFPSLLYLHGVWECSKWCIVDEPACSVSNLQTRFRSTIKPLFGSVHMCVEGVRCSVWWEVAYGAVLAVLTVAFAISSAPILPTVSSILGELT